MQSNIQTITENIFSTAIDCQEKLKYKELKPTNRYNECNTLFIDHNKKTYWFTTKEVAKHTNKIANS